MITDAAITTPQAVAFQDTPVSAETALVTTSRADQRELSTAFLQVLLDHGRVSESTPPEQGCGELDRCADDPQHDASVGGDEERRGPARCSEREPRQRDP